MDIVEKYLNEKKKKEGFNPKITLECQDCKHIFKKKADHRTWGGQYKCPKCGSKNIEELFITPTWKR